MDRIGQSTFSENEAIAQDSHHFLPSPDATPDDNLSNPSPASGPPDAVNEPKAATRNPESLQKHSCVVCATRKIKCDRRDPCGNCVKGRSNCIYRAPAPPRRRKKGAAEAEVLERLKRAEEMLLVRSDGNDATSLNNLMWRIADISLEKRGQLVNSSESSRYLDNSMWIFLNEELRDIRAVLEEDPEGEGAFAYGTNPTISEDDNFASTVFGGSPRSVSLADQHPTPVQIMQIWQLFLQNVHPITKLIHSPTTQQMIIDAASHLDSVSRSLEALMFCMYFLVIVTLSDEECERRFHDGRSALVARYRSASQAALLRADYLTSYNFQILQAYMMYLIGCRGTTQPAAMWALSGIAVRMGHRMGLHRDGAALGLPIFEVEMRRRLWWEIIFFDSRMAQLSGTGGIAVSQGAEYKTPSNVNDSELYPGMTTLPPEHDGITDMVHSMIRAEVGNFLISFPRTGSFDGSWQGVTHSTVPINEKDKLINALEARLQEKFVSKLDPLVPNHLLARCIVISAQTTIRFMAHHPRRHVHREALDPDEENLLFNSACGILENTLFMFTDESLQRFAYYTRMHFQYLALIYLLRTLRRYTRDAKAQRGWHILHKIYSLKPPILPEAPGTLQLAIADLTFSAWEARAASDPTLTEPDFIQMIRGLRGNRGARAETITMETGPGPGYPAGDLIPPPSSGVKPEPTQTNEFSQSHFSGGEQANSERLDWAEWESFVQGNELQDFDLPWQGESFSDPNVPIVPANFGDPFQNTFSR